MIGGIDHNKIVARRERIDGIGERLAGRGLIVLGRIIDPLIETGMIRRSEIAADMRSPGAPVLDVMGETLLSEIKIERGDALARFNQRDGDVHCDGGFPRPALFIRHNDDPSPRRA